MIKNTSYEQEMTTVHETPETNKAKRGFSLLACAAKASETRLVH